MVRELRQEVGQLEFAVQKARKEGDFEREIMEKKYQVQVQELKR